MNDNERREKLQRLVTAIADVLEMAFDEARARQPQVPVVQSPVAATPERGRFNDGLWLANDVAEILGVSRSWVYNEASVGRLPCIRVGALLRFRPDQIRALVGIDSPEPKPVKPPGRAIGAQTMPMAPRPVPPPAPTQRVEPALAPAAPAPQLRLPVRPIEKLLSTRQVAERLGLSTATVYKLCETGRLKHVRIANAIKVLPQDLEECAKNKPPPRSSVANETSLAVNQVVPSTSQI